MDFGSLTRRDLLDLCKYGLGIIHVSNSSKNSGRWNRTTQGFDLIENFEHLSKQLILWNKNQFGFIHDKLKNLESQLKFIQYCSQNSK